MSEEAMTGRGWNATGQRFEITIGDHRPVRVTVYRLRDQAQLMVVGPDSETDHTAIVAGPLTTEQAADLADALRHVGRVS